MIRMTIAPFQIVSFLILIVFVFVNPAKSQLQPERMYALPENTEIETYAISNDGSRIAAALFDYNVDAPKIVVMNATTGEQISKFSGHTTHIQSVAFSPDGSLVVSGGNQGKARLWNANTGEEIATILTISNFEFRLGGPAPISAVAFSTDGKRFATAENTPGPFDIQIWDTQTHQELLRVNGFSHVLDLEFSPNGKFLLAVSSSISLVFDIEKGELHKNISGAGGTISQDGKYVYILSSGKESKKIVIEKWDIETGELVSTTPDFSITEISGKVSSISKDGRFMLITSDSEQKTVLYDVQKFSIVQTFDNNGMNVFQNTRFAPDQSSVLGFKGIKLFKWDISNLTASIPGSVNMNE